MLSTVTDKGQVTLPKPIRDRLGIAAGARIEFEVLPDDTIKVRVLTRGSAGLFGLVSRPGEPALSLDAIDGGIALAVAARAKRAQRPQRPQRPQRGKSTAC